MQRKVKYVTSKDYDDSLNYDKRIALYLENAISLSSADNQIDQYILRFRDVDYCFSDDRKLFVRFVVDSFLNGYWIARLSTVVKKFGKFYQNCFHAVMFECGEGGDGRV